MCILLFWCLYTFFPRGYNLEGKSSNRRSPRVHKASAMLWRKGNKPSFVRPNFKVWVPVNVLPTVAVSFPPPPLTVSEEIGSPSDDVHPNHRGVPHLSPHRIFGYRDYKRRLVSFLLLCLKVSFLLFFSPSITPKIWFVCFCCCLSFLLLFSVLMLAMLYNCLKF
jgi:hypothetical protein